MPRPHARPVARFNAKALAGDAIVLAIESEGEETLYLFHPKDFNGAIERMLVASMNAWKLAPAKQTVARSARSEVALTFPLEKVAASRQPTEGSVGINLTLPTGLNLNFAMPPQVSLALCTQIQAAAGKLQVPKSTAKH